MIDLTVSGRVPFGLTRTHLVRAVDAAFGAARVPKKGSVAVRFVTPLAMRKLNRTYRHKDRETDVLSFEPATLPAGLVQTDRGDIIVDARFVAAEAKRRSIAPREEALRVVIHGVLHLLGYDHATERDELDMFTRQEQALAKAV